jgi:PAS domain S-box-containing protein
MAADDDSTLTQHLQRIETYMRGCELHPYPHEPSPLRSELVGFLRSRLDEVLESWLEVVTSALAITPARREEIRESMREAQLRWYRHVENPADVETYRFLRDHARGGFISQFPASRFLATQMKMRQLQREALLQGYADHPEKLRDLAALLDQEYQERILHITDFFVEAKVEELHEHELSYRQTIDAAPAPIFAIDAETARVTDANLVAERTTGFRREELVGRLAWELHPPDQHDKAKRHWQETLAQLHRTTEELSLLQRSGERVPVYLSSGVIDFGRARIVNQIYVDLSTRRRLESQLIQSEKMAAIGQLAAGVAHEIRNPLGAIRNALYDLKEILADGPPDAKEDLAIAEEELVRAKAIIDNLLEFSRVSRVDHEPVDLNDVLRKTLFLMNKYLQNSDVRVETDLSPIPNCLANQNAMRQVVLNLVTNAVQAMPSGGVLALRTWTMPARNGGAPRIAVEIRDTGVGIPDEQLNDIFNPFFTTKAPGQGTGLGLSVVDSIVRQAQGEIHVESRVGEGTTFRLDFPCNCPDPAAAVEDVA